jgi:formylglycine-generating enzyme required for sulfatase activity
VEFDLAQENTFGDLTFNGKAFSDYIYIFIKFDTDNIVEENVGWQHATLTQTGSSSEFTVTSDGKGAFIKASDAAADLTLVWQYSDNGVSSSDDARVKVMAIEMVKIPTDVFRYQAGDITSSSWANGYSSFYIMKYEVSQGQYVDFLNAISTAQATARSTHSYTDYQHVITYASGNPYGSRYSTTKPFRACGRMSWDDCKYYASWCALRPMTEMEYEKAARGGGGALNTRTYPWGEEEPWLVNPSYIPAGSTGDLRVYKYYANLNDQVGDMGPTQVGLYLSGDIARTDGQTGASPYGVTDMLGNLWESCINTAWGTTPLNGDGTYSLPATWPLASSGKGWRGNTFDTWNTALWPLSNRQNATRADAGRDRCSGLRCARTIP